MKGGFTLVEQYEHALISGEFARHWGWEPRPSGSAIYAITEHDLAWKELDAGLRWNPETGKPYNFFEYPVEPRLSAYRRGIDAIERDDAYAALLCSLHYEAFVKEASGVVESSFRAAERERQSRILSGLPEEERNRAEEEIRLLRMCDDLSLFLCLNEPGENEWPWYRDGFRYGGQRIMPVWEESHTLGLEPSPIAESFGVSIPYTEIDEAGHRLDGGSTEILIAA